MQSPPSNRSQFLKLMNELDDELRTLGVPPHARPLHAELEIAQLFGIGAFHLPSRSDPDPESFHGEDLIAHAHIWYEKQYGDRLKVDMSPGRIALLVQRDPWQIAFPRVCCPCRFVCVRSSDTYTPHPRVPTFNVLHYIVDMTDNFRDSLPESELLPILEAFARGFTALHTLECLKQAPYIPEATGDLRIAVDSIVSDPPRFHFSKWHSSQVVEKVLKCFLQLCGVSIPRTHQLAELAALAEQNGLDCLSRDLLARAQGTPSMRYGDDPVDLDEAMDAHHTSLDLVIRIGSRIHTKES